MTESLNNSDSVSEKFHRYLQDPLFSELANDCLSLSTEELVIGWEQHKQREADADFSEKIEQGFIILGES